VCGGGDRREASRRREGTRWEKGEGGKSENGLIQVRDRFKVGKEIVLQARELLRDAPEAFALVKTAAETLEHMKENGELKKAGRPKKKLLTSEEYSGEAEDVLSTRFKVASGAISEARQLLREETFFRNEDG
jgi:hypothetical protein